LPIVRNAKTLIPTASNLSSNHRSTELRPLGYESVPVTIGNTCANSVLATFTNIFSRIAACEECTWLGLKPPISIQDRHKIPHIPTQIGFSLNVILLAVFYWRSFKGRGWELDISNHNHSPTHEDWVFQEVKIVRPFID